MSGGEEEEEVEGWGGSTYEPLTREEGGEWRGGRGGSGGVGRERREWRGGEGVHMYVCTPDKNPNTFPSQTVANR